MVNVDSSLGRRWSLTCRKDAMKNRKVKVKGGTVGKRQLREAFRNAAVMLKFGSL